MGQQTVAGADEVLAQSTGERIPAVAGALARPEGLAIDTGKRRMFVSDTGNGVVRRIDQQSGLIDTVAGDPSSATAPGTAPLPATEVRLQRPTALAVDSAADEVFVVDDGSHEVLRLQLNTGQPDLVSVLLSNLEVARPRAVRFHRFANGQRLLFVLDRGQPGSNGVPGIRPTIQVVDLDSAAVPPSRAVLTPVFSDPPGLGLRIAYDLALRARADGGADLFVAADIGENFAEYNFGRPAIDPPAGSPSFGLDFETDCYDGVDGADSDLLADGDDPDCSAPLNVQVLRFSLPANGLALGAGSIDLAPFQLVRCHKRFIVEQTIFGDPSCSGQFPPPPPPIIANPSRIDLPDFVVDAMAVDDTGRLFLTNVLAETVLWVDFDGNDQIASTGIVAGTTSEVELPFDGNDPRLTRLSRPCDLQVDDVGNLYIVDTINNRVRRTWVRDIVQGN